MIDDVIAAARAALNTPFRHQGRIVGVGIDCVGLLCHVWEAVGAPYCDQQGYSRTPHRGRLKMALDSQPGLLPISSPEPGCVMLMRYGKEPTHVAIYTGSTIIHAYQPMDRVVEHDWPDGVCHLVTSYRITRGNK